MKKLPTKLAAAACAVLFSASAFAAQTIYIHAHRGEPHLAPQNTPESIALAFDLGARMIETDFHITKDGTMVCMHGRPELKRLWGIDKEPKDLTIGEIRESRLAQPEKFDKRYANCKIPTIDDIFAVIPKDKSFELEIKTYGDGFADKVEAARKKAGLGYKNILITSFSPAVIKDFKEKYPQYETLLIVSCPKKGKLPAKELIKKAKDAGASQVAIGNYKKLDRTYIKEIQDAGLMVGLWQVENLNDLAIAAKLGADRVCSNYCAKLRADYKRIKELNME